MEKYKVILFIMLVGVIGFFMVNGLGAFSSTEPVDFSPYIMMSLGIAGLILTVIGPIFLIENVKSGETESGIVFGLLFLILGPCLIIAWLY